jgi:hypothetical protein
MSTCPSSCTGTCPEIVPVEITQNIISFASGNGVEYVYEATGDGTTTEYTLASTPLLILGISIGGVDQPTGAYTLAGAVLTFDDAPADGEDILVRCLTAGS